MIKIVHTSDWHAGKTNGKESRREDLQYALEELKNFIKKEKVDCLLVCGDIFDKHTISPQDISMVLNFFVSIGESGTKSILITGNHDSPNFFKSLKEVLRYINVYAFDRVSAVKNLVLPLEIGRDENREKITFFALPYLNPNIPTDIRETFENENRTLKYIDFVVHLLSRGKTESDNTGYPSILLSHIAISEAKLGGTEKEISVRSEFCIPHKRIPSFLYCALGHIHKHQELSDTKRIYYSGTLYQIDFGEEKDEEKGFYFFTVKNGKIDKEPEFIKVPLKRKMKTYRFDLSEKSPYKIIEELKKEDETTLKRIFLRFKEEDKHKLMECIFNINKYVNGVIYINQEEKTEDTELPENQEIEAEGLDIISLYERFYEEVKKEKRDLFYQRIKPVIMKILEETTKEVVATD